MTTETLTTAPAQTPTAYTAEQINLLRRTIAKDCTRDELALFIGQCKRTGLDPFARQIYAIKMDGRLTIQTSIDGFRLIAQRSGHYAGQLGPFCVARTASGGTCGRRVSWWRRRSGSCAGTSPSRAGRWRASPATPATPPSGTRCRT